MPRKNHNSIHVYVDDDTKQKFIEITEVERRSNTEIIKNMIHEKYKNLKEI